MILFMSKPLLLLLRHVLLTLEERSNGKMLSWKKHFVLVKRNGSLLLIPFLLLWSVRKKKTILEKVPKSSLSQKSSSQPTSKASSSSKSTSTVKAFSSFKVYSKSTSRPKKQVPKPVLLIHVTQTLNIFLILLLHLLLTLIQILTLILILLLILLLTRLLS